MKRYALLKLIVNTGFLLSLLSAKLHADYEDFLNFDDRSFHSGDIEDVGPRWTDGFKTTIQHNHSQTTNRIIRQESSLRVEYETGFAQYWYLRVDGRYRYFWSTDALAKSRGKAYGHTKWQQGWLQYSRGACALKAGRQTLIWGEVDGTFVTDVITPFDYTEQLLTDFGNIRRAQDMIVADCFLDRSQLQLFLTPNAKTDRFQHHPLFIELQPGQPPVNLRASADEELGFRYKWMGTGYDISVMYASLYGNTPTIVLKNGQPTATVVRYDLVGLTTSIAYRRLLIKAEVAFKNNQPRLLSDQTSNQWDSALGFEYTTRTNHALNAGIWISHLENNSLDKRKTVTYTTAGWRNTYLNDTLVMSLLANRASSPRFSSIALLSEYQWTDFFNVSLAVAHANSSEDSIMIPLAADGTSITLGIKYEF